MKIQNVLTSSKAHSVQKGFVLILARVHYVGVDDTEDGVDRTDDGVRIAIRKHGRTLVVCQQLSGVHQPHTAHTGPQSGIEK